MRPPRSLRLRFIALIALALTPALAITWANAETHRAEGVLQVHEQTVHAARLAAAAQERTLHGARQLFTSLAWLVPLHAEEPERCHEVLVGVVRAAPQYSGLAIIAPDGRYACSSRGLPPPALSFVGTTSYDRAVATRTFAVGDYRLHRITGQPVVGLALPVYGPDGALQGTVGGTLDLAWLGREIAGGAEAPGDVYTVIDSAGTVLARHPDHARWVGQRVPEERLAALGAEEGTVEAHGIDGVARVYAYTRLHRGEGGDGDVWLFVGRPLAAAYAATDAEFHRDIGALAAAGLLAFAAAWFASDAWVVRPLRRLRDAARRLGRGDLRIRTGLPHGSHGEVGDLARGFDEMAASLEAAVARERAARRELEAANRRLEELDRFRSQFVHQAAHELGNPLTPITLQLHLLRNGGAGPLAPAQARALDVVERNTERLARLVADMLDAARIQTGHLAMAPEDADLGRIAREAAEAYQAAARAAGVDLEVRAEPGVRVRVDPQRLGQVLDNLLGNALKFTAAGGRVLVEAARVEGHASVRIVDSGAGFDPAEARRLFQPFSQLHEPRRGGAGSGLGLYISRGIVERMGGTIEATSDGPGRGAAFTVRLPLDSAPGDVTAPEDAGEAVASTGPPLPA